MNYCVGYFAAAKAKLAFIPVAWEAIFEQALERDLAKRSTRFRSAQYVLQRLSRLRHLISRKLDGAQLLLDFSQGLMGILQFSGHCGLRLRRNLRRLGN